MKLLKKNIATIIGLTLATILMATPSIAVASWGSQTQLSSTGQATTQAPQFLIGNDGTIFAFYISEVSGMTKILSRSSTNGGTSWGTPFVVNADGANSSELDTIKLPNGTFVLAWTQTPISGASRVALTSSPDSGNTWTQINVVSTASNSSWAAQSPTLAALGNSEVALGFRQSDGSNNRAMIRTSDSNLQNWDQGHVLSAQGNNAENVTPVVNANGEIVVSWILTDPNSTPNTHVAQVAGSSDRINWSPTTTLSSHAVSGNPKIPVVVALPSGAFVALWCDPSAPTNPTFTVKSLTSTDAGTSWGLPVDISTSSYPDDISALVTPDGFITAVWGAGTGGYTNLESSHSSPSTSSPTPSPSSSSSASPSGGTSWQAPVVITQAVTGQYYTSPQLSLSPDGTLAMTFEQTVNSTSSAGFAFSSDNGVSWPQGVGTVSSWLSAPVTLGEVSIQALSGQGFIFGWQTLSNSNPQSAYTRVYGWVENSTSPSPTAAPTLSATGFTPLPLAILSAGFLLTGLVMWTVTSWRRRLE